jgi:chemotaxis protein histidine kinase CheA
MIVHTDKDLIKAGLEESVDAEQENQDESLNWLLDMDLSEPEEKLFTVTGNEYKEEGLSAFEAQVAARPLTRGNANSDDLASYVDEEIVISSASATSDIYADSDVQSEALSATESGQELMALDFSLERNGSEVIGSDFNVDDGTDILGLSSDDDIGEKFLSIKRVKPRGANEVEKVAAEAVAEVSELPLSDHSAGTIEAVDAGMDVGGEVQSTGADQNSDATVEAEVAYSVSLSEAPVTMQVADPAIDAVANDSPSLDEGDSGDFADLASALDYVASMPEIEDDDEFDNFLLGAEQLGDDDVNLEDLTLEEGEEVVSFDSSIDDDIDYHEDFHALENSVQSTVSDVAAVITPVMEEISHDAQARAASLGLGENAVVVDVMLGSDEESIKQCYAAGYEPVSAICSELPAPLRSLQQTERDAVYVRLLSSLNGDNWNDLFSQDFMSASEASLGTETSVEGFAQLDDAALLEDFLQPEDKLIEDKDPLESIDLQAAFTEETNLEAGFGEDIFSDTFEDDFTAELPTLDDEGDVADIDAAFTSMSESQGSVDEICGVDFEEFESSDEDDQPLEAQEAPVMEEPQVEEESELMEVSASQEPEQEVVVVAGTIDLIDESSADWCIPKSIEFSSASQSNAEIFAEFLDAFIEEGSAEIEKLENLVGEWEKDVESESIVAEVSRTLHTIKGIAKGVGLQRMGTLVHNYETLLERLPRPEAGDEQTYFRVVNAWLDAVVRGIEFITDSRVDIASELPVVGRRTSAAVDVQDEVIADVDIGESEEAAASEVTDVASSTVLSELEKKRDQQLADEGAKVLAAQQSVRITSEKLDHMLNLASQAQQLGVRASQNTSRSKRSSAELQGRLTSVRNHIGQIADRALLNVNTRAGSSNSDLDALEMDQYSELQEAASILREGVEDLGDLVDVVSRQNAQIEALLKQQSSVISGISSAIQGARVVPVSRLMAGLRRIVRTVSADLGKVVTFNVLNETGALDRDHYARLQVVMEHMVRNALDHGIELPDDRLAAGKPVGGRITLDVRKAGGDYIVRLSDDGKGIDADAIRESAYQKGMDVDVDALSDDEAMRLIFHKGFSTASTLSEVSGRGVGMDIVLTELQQMGGDIEIQSAVGLGTSFEVRIPSNVSVNGALLVAAGEESYAIPLNGLVAVEQVAIEDFYAAIEQSTTLRLFDADCEPAYLATLCKGQVLPDKSIWEGSIPVIIAGTADRYMAIAIDNLEEALELVVRSLGSQFAAVPGLAGAATTSDGEAIVALDLNMLVKSVGIDGLAPIQVTETEDRTLLALVVDDSRTQRMVATSQLDTVGVETITAENGLVAIDLLNAAHRLPDVVLLDVEMPVKDGIETLREIRKSQRYGDLPVIMVTSRTGAKHRAMAKEAGCNAYMGKPFNFPALIEQINDLTGYDLQLS